MSTGGRSPERSSRASCTASRRSVLIGGLLGKLRGGNHPALEVLLGEGAVQPIPPRPRFVPKVEGLALRLQQQKARWLACDYYHVIFTFPSELNAVWSLERTEIHDG